MIDILLATYNGEKYLADQIESIENQTYKNFRILVRDDGSTDNTMGIIEKYTSKYDNIFLIKDNISCKSAKRNFFELMKHSTADYIMFCDQDDIWLENKIEIMYNKMILSEKIYMDSPILVASNQTVVDYKLQKMHRMSMKYDETRLKLNHLLVDNVIPGCTMMFNKKLLTNIKYINMDDIIMHDWWIVLNAICFGKIVILNDELMLYRQHSNNESGAAQKNNVKLYLNKFRNKSFNDSYNKLWKQSFEFFSCYKESLDENTKNIIIKFINLKHKNKISRIYITIKNNFFKSGIVRQIGQLFFLFIWNSGRGEN
ncbi:glycosyltransferase family 2 protein [Thomasclavelia ramosa]|uniref:glycosyltransferase family 2 protein n=1 Tax=Thomasclavelia ramosa TaxID=1547 RepID=UPI0022E60311|nr:glycosyltransferase family 2 protein [Thomasclavelia ramosa]